MTSNFKEFWALIITIASDFKFKNTVVMAEKYVLQIHKHS